MKVVWAHVGLSKELKDLHPVVHMHILTTLFERQVDKKHELRSYWYF